MYFLAFCIPFFAQHGVDFISLIAPTSANRIAMITREARGFIYVVSRLGVAGEKTSVPCAVGFGISIPQQAHDMAAISDGAIVGSAIIRLLEQYGTEAPAHIGAFVKSMKDAL